MAPLDPKKEPIVRSTLPVLLVSAALCAPLPSLAAGSGLDGLGVPGHGPSLDPADVGAQLKGKKAKKGKRGKKPAAEPTPTPAPPDGDGDGIPDSMDTCPAEAEDKDGWKDDDGCPDPDNDGDGVADKDDRCPDEAENVDGWDDEDGCPEAAPAIAPMTIDGTLNDGTKIKGTIVRIVAVDEDEKDGEPREPTDFQVVIDDADELPTPWSNLRRMKAEKVNFTDAVDCYSEGVQDLGDDAPLWECTLRNPTVITLAKVEKKGTHLFLDRKMQRLDLKIDDLSCEGPSCEGIEESRTLSIYPYRVMAMTKDEDEFKAVSALQKRLRIMQASQIKSATFAPKAVDAE